MPLLYYTRDWQLTTADAADCVIQVSEEDARRRGLPMPGTAQEQPAPEPPVLRLGGTTTARPADKRRRGVTLEG